MAATQQPSSTGIRLYVSNQTNDTPVETGPDKILNGYVEVDEALLKQADKIEIQYRGVEVVGGTVADFDDDYVEGLQPRTGMRAISKVYFDERLTVWQRSSEPAQPDDLQEGLLHRRFDFCIAFPHANYPAQVRSTCDAAPSQSFEIAYHVVGWAIGGPNGASKSVQNIGFAPHFMARTLPPAMVPQAPVTQTAYDDRGRECLFTRVTLSQPDYVPGDQVVAGVYIECIKSNRTVRRAEAQLRQRVECRMRRTYSSAETAELASGSRPQSSQPSTHSDDSDVLWTRTLDMGAPQPLTLTTSGVGLAAAAASGCISPGGINAIGASLTGSLAAGASTCSLGSSDHVTSETPAVVAVVDKRESTLARAIGPKGSGIIAGYRSCSANMHTNIPVTASAVPGHFLIFSYELLVDVTLSSLTRGNHRMSTRTPLGSATGAATPTSATNGDFALNKQTSNGNQAPPGPYHRALSSLQTSTDGAVAPNGSGSFSATAAYFPQNQQQPSGGGGGGGMLDGREKAQLKGSRFSVGAFQGGSGNGTPGTIVSDIADSNSTPDHRPSVRYSTIQAAPIHRGTTQSSAIDDENDAGSVLPNAVDLMRFKYDTSVVVVPKIFVPVAEIATVLTVPSVDVVSGSDNVDKDIGKVANGSASDSKDVVSISAAATDDAHISLSAEPKPLADALPSSSPGTAPAEDEPKHSADDSESSVKNHSNSSDTNNPTPQEKSAAASECDLASAVYAAAEKVLNDKEWDRPNSIYLATAPKLDKKKTMKRMKQVMAQGGVRSFKDSVGTNASPLNDSRKRSSTSTSDTEGSDETEEEEEEDIDVQRAINRLAPQSRSSSLTGGVRDIISGIDFFGADAGPELTGLLSADPDKLVFGVTPMMISDDIPTAQDGSLQTEEQGIRVASSTATAYSPVASRDDSDGNIRLAEQQPNSKQHTTPPPPTTALPPPPLPQMQRINSALRRSMSMPGGGSSLSAVVAAAHNNEGSSSSTANMCSPESTVARSAFETGGSLGDKVLIRKNFLSRAGRSNSTAPDGTGAHLAGFSPRSMVSAVSSTSRLGGNSRVGVFRTLSHRFTSWFKK
ncbi:hypothetical protein IW140_004715 [Coemansia sp. RSA 1813]|nr:hypothetical protein EV178_005399 [Coemansia sp. RSA 1646]KAJ1770401.1 hypothetical protein LPJ74_003208 [Coemansia sp. RSA 1843]KAJ2088217.1 hypothetical protein IW138_004389 [Coemansia sp. RSA 986]KAJ2215740.1 hypothetical protein EV179_001964 [Coemansia sp. RSA 487]KAJ2566924.1 hypothetical protein IW140_004715 [Coemansia sp. RSA 1813]